MQKLASEFSLVVFHQKPPAAADGSQLCCPRAEVGGEELEFELSKRAGLVHEEVRKRRKCFQAGVFNVKVFEQNRFLHINQTICWWR